MRCTISAAGIVPVAVNADQTSAAAERARQRRDHPARLELGRCARPIGLRGDDQIVVPMRAAASRPNVIEQELAILAIDDQDHRLVVDRIAGLRADACGPVLAQERLQLGDLPLEIARRVAGEAELLPDHAACRLHRVRREQRRLGVVHVGHDQHGRGMLAEPVRHLLERQANILEADFLADDIERKLGEATVHRPHHPRRAPFRRRRPHRKCEPPADWDGCFPAP